MTAEGNKLVMWETHGGPNQIWMIAPWTETAKSNNQGFQPNVQPSVQVPTVELVINPNTSYKISSAVDLTKVLTITKDNKARFAADKCEPSQKFKIYQNNGTSAFVVESSNAGLCVAQDGTNNGAEIVASPSQTPSSWFTMDKCTQGVWANKGYVLKTHTKKHGIDLTS